MRPWPQLRGSSARDVLAEFPEIVEPPVPVLSMARHLGMYVYEMQAPPPQVFMSDVFGGFGIPTDARREGQRVIAARGIGLLLWAPLDGQWLPLDWRATRDPLQRAADTFALGLLVPSWMIDITLERAGRNLVRAAYAFQVSPQALQLRLQLRSQELRRR